MCWWACPCDFLGRVPDGSVPSRLRRDARRVLRRLAHPGRVGPRDLDGALVKHCSCFGSSAIDIILELRPDSGVRLLVDGSDRATPLLVRAVGVYPLHGCRASRSYVAAPPIFFSLTRMLRACGCHVPCITFSQFFPLSLARASCK
jgi:hypothetical protein